jgi:hypothetical protein
LGDGPGLGAVGSEKDRFGMLSAPFIAVRETIQRTQMIASQSITSKIVDNIDVESCDKMDKVKRISQLKERSWKPRRHLDDVLCVTIGAQKEAKKDSFNRTLDNEAEKRCNPLPCSNVKWSSFSERRTRKEFLNTARANQSMPNLKNNRSAYNRSIGHLLGPSNADQKAIDRMRDQIQDLDYLIGLLLEEDDDQSAP